jgi:hypothetical protein
LFTTHHQQGLSNAVFAKKEKPNYYEKLQKIDVFIIYLLLLINLLPARHIYFKIHTDTLTCIPNLNIY